MSSSPILVVLALPRLTPTPVALEGLRCPHSTRSSGMSQAFSTLLQDKRFASRLAVDGPRVEFNFQTLPGPMLAAQLSERALGPLEERAVQ